MYTEQNNEMSGVLDGGVGDIVKNVAAGISARVKQKYGMIELKEIPDHVNYSKVEKYLRSIEVEITRRMFISYLKEELIPNGHIIKNSNYSYYNRKQIIYFILIDMFKPILPLGKVKVLFTETLNPVISEFGLDRTFEALCEIIIYMAGKFEEAVIAAVDEDDPENAVQTHQGPNIALSEKALYIVGNYTNLVTLCMAKGALDFYKFSPSALLD
jgi:hypothetical protein